MWGMGVPYSEGEQNEYRDDKCGETILQTEKYNNIVDVL